MFTPAMVDESSRLAFLSRLSPYFFTGCGARKLVQDGSLTFPNPGSVHFPPDFLFGAYMN